MNWIIVFLGIIAVASIGSFFLNIRNYTLQKSIELLSNQLERERGMYNDYRKQLEKQLDKQKDATDLWARKYLELEMQLKKVGSLITQNSDKEGTATE